LVDDEALQDAMRECGIGTPATRAATIEDLLSTARLYATREKKYIVPTQKGMEVIALLREIGVSSLTVPELTGEWELKLAQMQKGEFSRAQFMSEVKAVTQQVIDQIRAKARSSPLAAANQLGVPCPKCQGELNAEGRGYVCGCGFKFSRVIASYQLTVKETEQLLTKRETDFIDGLISKDKKPFTAKLVVEGDFEKINFVFPPKPEAPDESHRERVGACPKCQDDVIVHGDHYDCVNAIGSNRRCDFRVWGKMSEKRITKDMVDMLLRNQRTGLISGWKSSKSKATFSAFLIIKDGKVAFEFEKKT